MKYYKNDCTFVVPCYNPPPKLFRGHCEAILKFNMPIVICDDGSNKETKDLLKEYYADNNLVTIKTHRKNKGHQEAVKTAINMVQTKYMIRCDADDYYKKLPETEENEWDIILLQKSQSEITHYLEVGGSPIGSVYKTEVYKSEFLKDFKFKDDNELWVHEDIWTHFYHVLGDYKIVKSKNSGCVERNIHKGGMTKKKMSHKGRKCWETFLFWCQQQDKFDLYLEQQVKLLELPNWYKNA